MNYGEADSFSCLPIYFNMKKLRFKKNSFAIIITALLILLLMNTVSKSSRCTVGDILPVDLTAVESASAETVLNFDKDKLILTRSEGCTDGVIKISLPEIDGGVLKFKTGTSGLDRLQIRGGFTHEGLDFIKSFKSVEYENGEDYVFIDSPGESLFVAVVGAVYLISRVVQGAVETLIQTGLIVVIGLLGR